mgnify:CR=1 FL=1
MSELRTVAVIGAGDMGHGIAEVALIAGYKVFLQDVEQRFVDKGVARIHQSLEKLVEKGKVPVSRYEAIQNELLLPTVELDAAVKTADLVIEAIPENMDLKRSTFARIDRAAPEHTILASNTSTMKISDIADATGRPDRVVGLHYFNPAVLMRLVEVIQGEKTSEMTLSVCQDFVTRNGKVPVRVRKDVPGFIVNRVQAPGSILLQCILDAGIVEPDEFDARMHQLGMPMGPYEIMDFTGLDVAVGGCRYFADTVHPDYAPGKTLLAKVEAGHLGKKTGRGLYDWSTGRPAIDPARATDKIDPMDLVAVNINEATRLIEMGVCSAEDVDTAITNGTGNRIGPMAMARSMEPGDLSGRLDGLAGRFNKEIFKPTDMIITGAYR